jgi:hypothetical protein
MTDEEQLAALLAMPERPKVDVEELNNRRRRELYFLRPELAQQEPRPASDIRKVDEVDAEGRVKVALTRDGVVGFVGGYRQADVVHEYNPLDALKRD